MVEAGASSGPQRADGQSAAASGRSRRRWRRVLDVTALALAVLLVLVGVGGYVYVRHAIGESFPRVTGSLRVAGLDGQVEVDRDAHGIPQVYAGTGHDLMFAQGYVQAQDRFWQMDVYRHAAAGRLSEMFGSGQIRTDAFIRTMGWRELAEQNYALLSPASKRYLTAYADGVNAYLTDHHGGGLSFEYLALGLQKPYAPPRWTPVDSVGWLLALAWDLRDNIRTEIDRALSAASLSAAQVDQLFSPPVPSGHQPILAHGSVAGGVFSTSAAGTTPAAATIPAGALEPLRRLSDTIAATPGNLMPDNSGAGSNSWVVSGQHTTTGMPLLANDPHLSPELPSIWYQMGLHCVTKSPACPFEVSGFTMPGTPGVLIGHNDSVAWGFTNGAEDVTDLYLEKVSGDRYRWNGAWYPLTTRTEVIKVAGGKPTTITVRSTRHGPLVSDVDTELAGVGRHAPAPADAAAAGASRDGGYAVALRWTALEPNRTADALFELDTAQDWTEFRAAAADFSVPSQNMIYADTHGDIGYQTPGQIPIRRAGDGRWPVPGWTDAYEWTGYIPFAQLPNAYNPPQGYIVTANNQIVPSEYPYLLSKDFDYGYRAAEIQRRISQDIAGGRRISPAQISAIQLDQHNPLADTLVPYLRAVPVDAATARARDLLTGWDGDEPADSAAAAYFNQVWAELLRMAFVSKLPKDVDVSGESPWFAVTQNLLGDPTSPWWDDPSTPTRENRDQLLARAMSAARAHLADAYGSDPTRWRWGTMHTLTPTHQTLGANGPAPLRWLLNGESTPLGGGSAIVDANGFDAAKGFTVTQVPSMRMVVDTGNLDASTWINLTGASGHVSNPNYLDQFDRWRTGQSLPWPFHRDAVRAAAVHVLTLRP